MDWLTGNPFSGISTNPRDYVQGINPSAPNPLSARDQVQNGIMETFAPAVDDPSELPEYTPDPRYTKVLELLEEMATNTPQKRAKEREDAHFGKGWKKLGVGLLESLTGGYAGKDWKKPYDRYLAEETAADKEKRETLSTLMGGLKNIEVENLKGTYRQHAATQANAIKEQANYIKFYEAMNKAGVSDAQRELYLKKAKEVGVATAMKEFELEHAKNTGFKLGTAPASINEMSWLLGKKNPQDVPVEDRQKGALMKALLAPGVLTKAFGGEQRVSERPTTMREKRYGAAGNLLSENIVMGPSVRSTSQTLPNAGIRSALSSLAPGLFGGPQQPPPQPPGPDLIESGAAPAPPKPLPKTVPVPSPTGRPISAPTKTTAPGRVYDSAAAARIAGQELETANQRAETGRMGRNSVLRLLAEGKLDKFTGPMSGSQLAQFTRSLIGRNEVENTNMRQFLGKSYWDELFAYTGKQTNEREQKLAKELVPDAGTQNKKMVLQNVIKLSAFTDAALWRSQLGDGSNPYQIYKDFPMEKVLDAAGKLYDDLLKNREAVRKGLAKPMSEEVIKRRMNPETIFAEELRRSTGRGFAWDQKQ